MNKQQKKILGIYQTIISRATAKKRKCQSPGCSDYSINSHLMQRNGVLSHITENSHLIQIKPNDFFKIEKNGMVDFKKVGINNAISYPLFCNYHDTTIFKVIEESTIDFFDYRSQLLFSYRSLCAELRKKEKNIDIAKSILNSNTLKVELGKKFFDNEEVSLKGNEIAVNDLMMYKCAFESDILEIKNLFHFKTLKLPRYKISISSIFSYVDSFQSIIKRYSDPNPLNCIFANAIPQHDCLYIIIGYKKDKVDTWILDYLEKWEEASIENIPNLLSDLATRVETWTMAVSLYSSLAPENIQLFKDHFLESINSGIDSPVLYPHSFFI